MMLDPYLVVMRLFATWLRLRILMGFIIVWCIILIGLSGWMTESTGGTFSGYNFPSNRTYNSWSDVCSSAPYTYLSPFQFSFTTSTGHSSNVDTICPWPADNSDLRFTITVVGLVSVGLLFVKTPLSLFARPILALFAIMFFASSVIDAYASTTGLAYCNSQFVNSNLYLDIKSVGMTVKCNSSNFSGVVVIDLVISGLFFVTHTVWGLTKDLYVDKSAKKSDQKGLMKNMA